MSFRGKTAVEWALTKTYINPASVFRVFDLLYIQLKPYESKLSTALSERKAVARCATRKNRYGDKQNKNRWGLAKLRTPLGKHIRQQTERSLVCKTVSRNLQLYFLYILLDDFCFLSIILSSRISLHFLGSSLKFLGYFSMKCRNDSDC